MSHTGRDLRSSPAIIVASKEKRDDVGVAVAAGTFPPRTVGLRKVVALDHAQRRGLADLVAAGKMLRQRDCYFSAATRGEVSIDVGRFLKHHDFAVSGFNKEMVPTQRGRMIAKEMEDKDAAAPTD